ncbi:hypothetical protein QQZ08_008332 [Neonectria magnoliae]|uniref:Fungal N-terminal domain-containing protein n=1 Tax=Neonectria magnoliae TaxID=2732573 RepID=A0ABR1HWS2_9HYPO
MDPISAIGVAAASIQFADLSAKALLGSIRLLQSLRDAPKQVAALLYDVDKSIKRLVDLGARSQSDTNPLTQTLSRNQLETLRDVVSEGYQAVVDLQSTLGRVKFLPSDSKARKAWKSFLSAEMSRDFEIHLGRILRQHSEMLQQLQLAGLDVAVTQGEQIAETGSIIKELRKETERTQASLAVLQNSVPAAITGLASSCNQFQTKNALIGAAASAQQSATYSMIQDCGLSSG